MKLTFEKDDKELVTVLSQYLDSLIYEEYDDKFLENINIPSKDQVLEKLLADQDFIDKLGDMVLDIAYDDVYGSIFNAIEYLDLPYLNELDALCEDETLKFSQQNNQINTPHIWSILSKKQMAALFAAGFKIVPK